MDIFVFASFLKAFSIIAKLTKNGKIVKFLYGYFNSSKIKIVHFAAATKTAMTCYFSNDSMEEKRS